MSDRLVPGFYPFWFWNDTLEEGEIRRQIAEMAAQGVKGFYIHPRQGLQVPYLSDAFFRMVEVAVEEAERLGLTVHLYDEYPYPSGVAGGEVILGQPKFLATRLVQRSYDLTGGHVRLALPRGKLLACVAYPLRGGGVDFERGIDLRSSVGIVLTGESYVETGLTQYNRKRYFASEPTPVLDAELPSEPHRLYVSVQALVEGHKYWHHYVDVLNPEAVREFLRLTHERYYARFKEAFGRRIRSIFVDETQPDWSDTLPAAFKEEYGYDLLPLLPALQDRSHPKHLQVARDLHRLKYKLFVKSFEEPIARWCKEHGILYAGEKPSLRFSQLRYSDLPGADPGHTKAGAKMDLLRPSLRSNARAVASAAYFYGKPGSLIECYHSLGWSGTLQDAKLIAEGLVLMGVDYLVPHGFFYSTHSLKKHDAPPSFFFQMPYWPHFGRLSQRIDRLYGRLEGSHIDAELLVVDATSGLPTRSDLEAYGRLLDALLEARVDFLVADTDVLESGRIGRDPEGTTRVFIRDIAAKAVLLPPMQVVEEPLRRWLNDFEAQGGTVLRFDASCDVETARRAILAAVPPHLDLRIVQGEGKGLQVVTRKRSGRRSWFLLNTARERLEVEIRAGVGLVEVPLDEDLPAALTPVQGGYRRTVHPFESFLLEEGAEANGSATPSPDTSQEITIKLEGPLKVLPANANLLRLYHWEMALLDEEGRVLERAPVKAVPLANQLSESGLRFAPRAIHSFGSIPRWELPELHVRYTASFESAYEGRVELVMEPGSLAGAWSLRVNDGPAFDEKAFAPTSAHVRGSLGMDITPYLRPGRNEVVVELSTDRHDGGLLNPLYLAGDFGVQLHPLQIVERSEWGAFEAWEANGLPFYAGVVEYRGAFRAPVGIRPDQPVLAEVDFGLPFDDACEISINGGPWRPLLWSPRRLLLPAGEVRPGRNEIAVKVYTSLIRSFEGQRFDIPSHAYQNLGEGFRNGNAK